MKEITLVTAFFDIGRGSLKDNTLKRSNDKYFQYFEHWDRMNNNLIVYTEKENVERIAEVRKKFNLIEKTKIIVIDDIYDIEKEIYKKMCEVEKKYEFKNFRYYFDAYSNTAKYDYIMFMKYWCLYDAMNKELVGNKVAWIDFGFDHGGNKYTNSEEFNFKWDYEFDNKINIFSLSNPEKFSSIESLQMQKDCIMGFLVYVPKNLIEEFWNLIRKSMEALLMLECIDDDQHLLLMAYKWNPNIFKYHISDWFMPLKEYGGEHLSIRKDNIHKPIFIKNKFKTMLIKNNKKQKEFAERCYNTACKHYKI